jgi:hypothetical protein
MDLDAIVEKIRDAIVGDLRKEFTEFKAEVRNPTALGQDLTGLVRRIDFLTLDMNRRFEDMAKRIESTMRS